MSRRVPCRVPRFARRVARCALSALAAACALGLAGCDRTREGARLYAAGRFDDALAAFRREVARAGEGASPALRHDEALAALRVGDLDGAVAAAEAAARGGDPAFAARRDFVRGCAAFARSEAAERAAAGARPSDATGRDEALAAASSLAEDALAAWRLAAASRADWPEARRNVERALLRIASLRERRSSGGARTPRPAPPAPVPAPGVPPPPGAPDAPLPTPPGPAANGAVGDLPAARVLEVLDLLREKEREKEAARRTRRSTPASAPGERDW